MAGIRESERGNRACVAPLAWIAFLLDGNGEIVGVPGARILASESDGLCAREIGCRDRHLEVPIVDKRGGSRRSVPKHDCPGQEARSCHG